MGEHIEALEFYQRTFEIFQKTLPSNHPSFAVTYAHTAIAHESMKELPNALESYKAALGIQQKSLPPNHPDLAKIPSPNRFDT